jgi:TolB protein
LTRTSDAKSFQLTDGSKWDRSPSWSPDSRRLYFVSDRGGTADLWRYALGGDGLPLDGPEQVTAGMEMLRAVSCADGKRLAYPKGRRVRNVFRAPILTNRLATWSDTTQLTFDEADFESVDVSRDGLLVLSSDRGGNWDLWTLPAIGGEPQQLTMDPALDGGPRWRSDGKEVVFYSSRTGHREIWIMPVWGGPARQVTRGELENVYPAWSPNGMEIARHGNGLPVVPAQGGAERHLTSRTAYYPDWSPDGKWVVFT